jgi:hypothetical protein
LRPRHRRRRDPASAPAHSRARHPPRPHS